MKTSIYSFFVILFISLLPNIGFAQSTSKETYFKHWTRYLETKNHIDINYRIIQCGTNKPQMHLQVFNESKIDQAIKFQVTITAAGGQSFTTDVSLATKKATTYIAWCDSDASTDKLKITLPQGYKPDEISVKIVVTSIL